MRLQANEVKRAIQLRNIVTRLGPAYIKLGQALSIRPDILSTTAMNELQKLCDKVSGGRVSAVHAGSGRASTQFQQACRPSLMASAGGQKMQKAMPPKAARALLVPVWV